MPSRPFSHLLGYQKKLVLNNRRLALNLKGDLEMADDPIYGCRIFNKSDS